MIDLNFQTFNNVVILNPFNLTKYLDEKNLLSMLNALPKTIKQ